MRERLRRTHPDGHSAYVTRGHSDGVEINGFVAPGFEGVAQEFKRNFSERGELGGAFVAFRDGVALVNLWAGLADSATTRPWTCDTLTILFSGSKGFVSMCMLRLLERGALELDAPIADYWPEFAAAGKADVLVRDLLGHTTRLPGVLTPVSWREATDSRRMAALLAAQPQSDDPRAASAYHAITFGWMCGELVRRVDSRTVGKFFDEEFARPLGLDAWIGLPPALEHRVSTIELSPAWRPQVPPENDELLRAIANPIRFLPGVGFPWNEPMWHEAEIPSSNAIASAHSIARLYASLADLFEPETLLRARTPISSGLDLSSGATTSFGLGFQLQTEKLVLGPPRDALGHGGAGGSRHGYWPTQNIGFSYTMNLLDDYTSDERGVALLNTLFTCVERADLDSGGSDSGPGPDRRRYPRGQPSI